MRTEGVAKKLFLLALPLMLSNLFQQLYNTVDAIIVGRYVGSEALAAVGTGGLIVTLVIYFFIGLSVGVTILIAQYWGAGDALCDFVSTYIFLQYDSDVNLQHGQCGDSCGR